MKLLDKILYRIHISNIDSKLMTEVKETSKPEFTHSLDMLRSEEYVVTCLQINHQTFDYIPINNNNCKITFEYQDQ